MNQQSIFTITKWIFIFCLFLIGTTVASADLVLTERFLIGGSESDEGLSVQRTTDGGYVLAGSTTSSDGNFTDSGYHIGDTDAFVAKVNNKGESEWVRCIGGSGSDYAISVQQRADGGLVIVGHTTSSDGNFTDSGYQGEYDAFVAKIDATGEIEWVRCIGGTGGDIGIGIQQTPDEGFVIAGYTSSIDGNFTDANHHGGSSDPFLAKIDSTGDIEWIRCVGGTGDNEYGNAIQLTTDGGYILGGQATSSDGDFLDSGYHTSSFPSIDTGDGFLAKVNATGTVEWTQCFGGSLNDHINDFQQLDDGWFVISGSTTSSDGDFLSGGYHAEWDTYIAKVNANGTVAWTRCIGSTGNEQGLSSTQTIEGNFIVSGFVTPYITTLDGDFADSGYHSGGSDAFLALVTESGVLEWVRCIGGSGGDNGQSIEQTDNGVIITGYTSSSDGDFANTTLHGSIDAFVVTLVNPIPAIDIEKTVSVDGGETFLDADTAPGPSVLVGDPVQWHYNITNIGNVPLTGITVTDDQGVAVFLPKTILDPGESMIGTASGMAIAGQYSNTGFVNSTYGDSICTDVDLAHYFGLIPPPVADFSGSPTTGDAPLSVSFIDTSTGSPTGWAWFFGDETYNASWTQQTSNAEWGNRSGHSTVAMPDGSVVLMGGWNGSTYFDDVWRSEDNGATWTQVTPNAEWSARAHHNSVTLKDGSIVLMGGYGYPGGYKNDVWRSTDFGATWNQVTVSAEWVGRSYFSSAVMPDGSIIVTGGSYDINHAWGKNDTWRSTNNGTTWVQMNAESEWDARYGHSTVALPDGSILLMSGYCQNGGWVNDVWRSTDNGATWYQVTPHAEWTGRERHVSLGMPDGSIIMMGGYGDPDGYKNDIWRSTDFGATWNQVTESAEWQKRSEYSSVIMRDGSIILMGGVYDSSVIPQMIRRDVWRLIPAGSTDQNPSHIYTTSGIYQVILHAFNDGGYNSTRKNQYIMVNASMTLCGNATINGVPVPAGSLVTASVLGSNHSVITDTAGWYGESEIGKGFVLRGPYPRGSPITFSINGFQARVGIKNSDYTTTWLDTVFPFFPNSALHLDLDAIVPITPNPTITVWSPNGGETWKQGSNQTIIWNYTGDPGSSVKIEVVKGTAVRVISSNTFIGSEGSGSFNFTFPFSTPLGSDYRIRVTSTSNVTMNDTSDAPFAIIPPLTVVSPNGGEDWQQGTSQTIRWNYIGTPGPTVKIEALKGDVVLAVINPGTPVGPGGSGSLNLTLPINAPVGTDYRIRVSSTTNSVYSDTSDAPFTISANTSSSLSVVSPNGGENWVQGSNQTIRWTYTGNPGSMVKIEALRNGTVLAVISPGTSIGSSGSGSYNLTFPYNTPLGSGYQFRVSSTSNPAWTDTSNGPFTIIPAITVATPNGGEKYSLGSNLSMSWTYSGNPGSMVNIDILKGPTVLKTLTGIPIGTGGSGSLTVTIPATTPTGSDYRIRVASASYPACFDASNGTFSIGVPG